MYYSHNNLPHVPAAPNHTGYALRVNIDNFQLFDTFHVYSLTPYFVWVVVSLMFSYRIQHWACARKKSLVCHIYSMWHPKGFTQQCLQFVKCVIFQQWSDPIVSKSGAVSGSVSPKLNSCCRSVLLLYIFVSLFFRHMHTHKEEIVLSALSWPILPHWSEYI